MVSREAYWTAFRILKSRNGRIGISSSVKRNCNFWNREKMTAMPRIGKLLCSKQFFNLYVITGQTPFLWRTILYRPNWTTIYDRLDISSKCYGHPESHLQKQIGMRKNWHGKNGNSSFSVEIQLRIKRESLPGLLPCWCHL